MTKVFLSLFLSLLVVTIGLSAKEKPEGIQVEVLTKTTKSWDGQELPPYKQGKPEITILKVIIPPKAKLPLHKHPIVSAGVILKGELTVIKNEKEIVKLKAGDTAVETINTWHYGRNDGNESVELIVFYVGVVGLPLTIKKEKK